MQIGQEMNIIEIRSVGEAISSTLLYENAVLSHVLYFIKELQLLHFGYRTWPHCDLCQLPFKAAQMSPLRV